MLRKLRPVWRYNQHSYHVPRNKNYGDTDWEHTFWLYFWLCLIGFIIYLIVAGIHYAKRPSHDRWYSTSDYLAAGGLDVNKTYHLRLGSATGGGSVGSFSLSTTTDFFLFAGDTTSTSSGQIMPSSTLRLGFQARGTSYILEIPYAKVLFKQKPGVRASVKFIINDYWLDKFTQHNVGANFWALGSGHPATVTPSPYKTAEWQHFVNVGLPTYLAKSLSRVIFTLTPQQYNAYLGTLQPSKD